MPCAQVGERLHIRRALMSGKRVFVEGQQDMPHPAGIGSGLMLVQSLVLSVALAACASEDAPAPPAASEAASAEDPVIQRGRQIVERHCATCHAVTATGRSPHPPAPSLARISENYPVTALEESLAEGMIVGHPDMPEFRLGPDDIRAVVGYLSSIQVKRGA
jgi:mono/diheme cytochrome c family protein